MLLIPAIDLKDGNCVRLRQGLMEDATVFSDQPADMASHWRQQGARRLHLVDLNGAFAGEPKNFPAIREILAAVAADIPVQLGGGIRDLATIEKYLVLGLTDVIIGTAAVKNPAFVREACREFAGHIIVGIDAKDGMVAIDGWATVTEHRAAEPPVVEPSVEEVPIVTDFDDNIDPVLVDIFTDEAQELLQTTSQLLEDDFSKKEVVEELQRTMHTLKGGARLVGFTAIGDTAHLMESVIDKVPELAEGKVRQAKTLLHFGLDAHYDMLDSVLRHEMPQPALEVNESLKTFADSGVYRPPSQKAGDNAEPAPDSSEQPQEQPQEAQSEAPQTAPAEAPAASDTDSSAASTAPAAARRATIIQATTAERGTATQDIPPAGTGRTSHYQSRSSRGRAPAQSLHPILPRLTPTPAIPDHPARGFPRRRGRDMLQPSIQRRINIHIFLDPANDPGKDEPTMTTDSATAGPAAEAAARKPVMTLRLDVPPRM